MDSRASTLHQFELQPCGSAVCVFAVCILEGDASVREKSSCSWVVANHKIRSNNRHVTYLTEIEGETAEDVRTGVVVRGEQLHSEQETTHTSTLAQIWLHISARRTTDVRSVSRCSSQVHKVPVKRHLSIRFWIRIFYHIDSITTVLRRMVIPFQRPSLTRTYRRLMPLK